MTIIHKGIRRKTTDVLDDYGQAHYAQNWRYRMAGEIGRRPGIGKTDMAKQAGPVLLLGFGSYFEPYVVQMVGSDVIATADPLPLWADPVMVIPGGQGGTPQAPTIDLITPSPASGTATYPAGTVSFLATVTYDGLSGALSYSWTNFNGGPSIPTQGIDNANPGTYIFDGFCPPGTYSFNGIGGLTVSTQFNGFSTTLAPSDYQVIP